MLLGDGATGHTRPARGHIVAAAAAAAAATVAAAVGAPAAAGAGVVAGTLGTPSVSAAAAAIEGLHPVSSNNSSKRSSNYDLLLFVSVYVPVVREPVQL